MNIVGYVKHRDRPFVEFECGIQWKDDWNLSLLN